MSDTGYYIDQDFLPEYSSLIFNPGKVTKLELDTWKSAIWLHYSEIRGYGKGKIANVVSVDKLMQGQMRLSHFTTVLASLATIPRRIHKLQITEDSKGAFEVNTFPMGFSARTKIDGYFPCVNNSLVFTYSNAGELWPMILEKAWAKYLGSYCNVINVNPSLAFTFLTGFPSIVLLHSQIKGPDMRILLSNYYSKKFPIVCTSSKITTSDDNLQFKSIGLIPDHPYALISLSEDNTTEEKLFVQLRNVWKIVDSKDTFIGDIRLSFDKYYKYFTEVTVCKYIERYVQSTLELPLDSDSVQYPIKFKIEKPCHMYVQVLEDYRKAPILSGLMVAYQNPLTDLFDYLESGQQTSHEFMLELELNKPGRYVCFANIYDALKSKHDKAILSISSEEKIELKIIKNKEKANEYLYSTMRSCAIQKGKKVKLAPGIYQYDTFGALKSEYSAVYYLNLSPSTALYYEANYKDKDAIQILSPAETEPRYRVHILPRGECSVCMKRSKVTKKIQYNVKTLLDRPKEELIKLAQNEAINCVNETEIMDGFQYKVYQHDIGFLFEFKNKSTNLKFIGTFEFTLTNLRLVEDKDNVFKIELKPKEIKYCQLKAIDPFKAEIKYSVNYQYDSRGINRSEEEIIEEVKTSGQEVKFPGNDISILSKYIDGNYCVYVRNKSTKILELTLTFRKPQNLECKDGDEWKVIVKPRDKGALKVLKQIHPFSEAECAFGIAYALKANN